MHMRLMRSTVWACHLVEGSYMHRAELIFGNIADAAQQLSQHLRLDSINISCALLCACRIGSTAPLTSSDHPLREPGSGLMLQN